LVIFIGFSGCDAVREKDNQCEPTKMTPMEEPTLYLKMTLEDDKLIKSDFGDTSVFMADRIEISGSVTKIYCSGVVSSKFTFNTGFYPKSYDYDFSEGEKIGQLYQFKFENTLDYILVEARVKAFLPGGRIFETDELIKKVYFKDLLNDMWMNQKYYLFRFPPDHSVKWFEVTR
jgi:hypothetical protein